MKNVLYLVDDYILYYSKKLKKLLKYKLPTKTLRNGKIANTKLFISSYKKFLTTHKLNNNLLGDTLTVIVNPDYTKVEIDILTNVFLSLSYRKINIVNEIKLYKLNSNNAYLNYNDQYLILTYQDEFKEKNVYLIDQKLGSNELLINLINSKLKNRNIMGFGLNKDLAAFLKRLESNSLNTGYYFANNESYLIDIFLEKKTCQGK